METILNSLLDMVETNLQKMEELGTLKGRSDYSISKEFRTIRLKCHRKSGHTTAIKNICKNRYSGSSLIVFPTVGKNERIDGVDFGSVAKAKEKPEEEYEYTIIRDEFYTPKNEYKIIVIDCDSVFQYEMKEEYIDFVKNLYKKYPESIFVFLQ
jgi:hypothetical protein